MTQNPSILVLREYKCPHKVIISEWLDLDWNLSTLFFSRAPQFLLLDQSSYLALMCVFAFSCLTVSQHYVLDFYRVFTSNYSFLAAAKGLHYHQFCYKITTCLLWKFDTKCISHLQFSLRIAQWRHHFFAAIMILWCFILRFLWWFSAGFFLCWRDCSQFSHFAGFANKNFIPPLYRQTKRRDSRINVNVVFFAVLKRKEVECLKRSLLSSELKLITFCFKFNCEDSIMGSRSPSKSVVCACECIP